MNLNKDILTPTPITIGFIVVISAIVGIAVWQFTKPAEESTPKQARDYTAQSICQKAGFYWYDDVCHKKQQSITQEKSIKVTSPNGGEQWQLGETYKIKWSTNKLDKVNIACHLEGGGGDTIAKKVDASLGEYSWKITESVFPGPEYKNLTAKISVSSLDFVPAMQKGIQDKSDESFTIKREQEEVKVGKIEINDTKATELQEAVDSGQQPWRLDPLMVAEAEATQYGFDESDSFILEQTMASAGVAKVEATHNGETYTVTLIQPTQGDGKIWMMRKIEKK